MRQGQPKVLSTLDFAAKFNINSFHLSHSLAGSELFSIDRIRRVIRSLVTAHGPRSVTCLLGAKGIDARWDEWTTQSSMAEHCLDRIDEPGSWVLVKNLETVPEYAELLQTILSEIVEAVGAPRSAEITWPSAYLFVSSPHFITPLHIDHEVGMLLQVAGSKEVHLFDHSDGDILTQEELEAYYMGDLASVRYRPELEPRSRTFHLGTGDGVCFPAHDPHWVQTGSTRSVSLSVNLCMRSLDRRALVYQANHYLRRLGIRPLPPGKDRLRDEMKRLPLYALSSRHPKSKGEMLRSGVNRISSVLRRLRRAGVSLPSAQANASSDGDRAA